MVVAAAVLATAGCSGAVAGHAIRPALPAVERALPAPADLERILGVTVDVDGLTRVGGLTALRDDGDAVRPRDCAGVTATQTESA
jgi:hypothetical protein